MRLTFILALLIGVSNVFAFENCITCHRSDQSWNYSDRCPRNFSYGATYFGSSYGCFFPSQHRHHFRGFNERQDRVVIHPTVVIPFPHAETHGHTNGGHNHRR